MDDLWESETPTTAQSGLERQMPFNLEAERAVLGSIVLDNEIAAYLSSTLKQNDFYKTNHARLWAAMMRLHESQTPIDYITIMEALSRAGDEEAGGGLDYLIDVVKSVPVSANAGYYAELVLQESLKREAIRITSELNQQAFDLAGPLEGFLDHAVRELLRLSRRMERPESHTAADIVSRLIRRLAESEREPADVIPTGFAGLDDYLGDGLRPGSYTLVVAAKNMGKTAFGGALARQIAVDRGIPVAYWTGEMPSDHLTSVFISHAARVPHNVVSSQAWNEQEAGRWKQAAMGIHDAPLSIIGRNRDDGGCRTTKDLEATVRQLVEERGTRVLIVDYLKLIARRTRSGEQPRVPIDEASAHLQQMAQEYGLAVVVFQQLAINRGEAGIEAYRPRRNRSKESSGPEEDCDCELGLFRPGYSVDGRTSGADNVMHVKVMYQRTGPTGLVALPWEPSCGLVHDGPVYDDADVHYLDEGRRLGATLFPADSKSQAAGG